MKKTFSDGEVTSAAHFHALMQIEMFGAIVAVDMQEERTRFRMLFLDKVDGSIEELGAQVLALIPRHHIELL